ncbi:hypothetical protein Lal_00047699 [Lupinus albus]|nr:hypothetical protein Lal_00047699 [Lupinus albus]
MLTFGLKISFHKSCFMGLKLSSDFVMKAIDKLYCVIGSIPFNFLVGANVKKAFYSVSIIDTSKKKLSLWRNIYNPKEKGGLGIINLFMFNLTLLGKWRWRLVKVLKSRYEVGFLRSGGDSDFECFMRGSSWSREQGNLSQSREGIGSGWMTLEKYATIESMCSWSNGVWSWKFQWGRDMFTCEEDEHEELLRHIHLEKCHEQPFFKRLWACNASTKMKWLVWKIVLDGVPTKVNLAHKGSLGAQDPLLCALCGEFEESTTHLFFSCSLIHNDVKTHFFQFTKTWFGWRTRRKYNCGCLSGSSHY